MKNEQKGHEEVSEDSQASRFKQARIRDNQRRSRARRQEHLQDLERRLSECHVACREAELQRSAFQDIQAENARLRELLALIGVNAALVDAFVRHDTNAQAQVGNSTLRQLKPKIALQPTVPSQGTSVRPSPGLELPSSSVSAAGCGSSYSQSPSPFHTPTINLTTHATFPSFDTPSTPSDGLSMMAPVDTQSFLPGFQGNIFGACNDDSFYCPVFGTNAEGPLQTSTENTVLCSLAKGMIEQYNIEGHDLEEVKRRLAAGFAPPAAPGECCRVNNQLLFDVLNDVSSRLS